MGNICTKSCCGNSKTVTVPQRISPNNVYKVPWPDDTTCKAPQIIATEEIVVTTVTTTYYNDNLTSNQLKTGVEFNRAPYDERFEYIEENSLREDGILPVEDKLEDGNSPSKTHSIEKTHVKALMDGPDLVKNTDSRTVSEEKLDVVDKNSWNDIETCCSTKRRIGEDTTCDLYSNDNKFHIQTEQINFNTQSQENNTTEIPNKNRRGIFSSFSPQTWRRQKSPNGERLQPPPHTPTRNKQPEVHILSGTFPDSNEKEKDINEEYGKSKDEKSRNEKDEKDEKGEKGKKGDQLDKTLSSASTFMGDESVCKVSYR